MNIKIDNGWLIHDGGMFRLSEVESIARYGNIVTCHGPTNGDIKCANDQQVNNVLATITTALTGTILVDGPIFPDMPSWDSHTWPIVVQEPSGSWFGWDNKPSPSDDGFYSRFKYLGKGTPRPNWKDTLTYRPKGQ